MWLGYSPISHPDFSFVTFNSAKNEIINNTFNEEESLVSIRVGNNFSMPMNVRMAEDGTRFDWTCRGRTRSPASNLLA